MFAALSENASSAPNLRSFLNARDARRRYARKIVAARDQDRQRHRRAVERLPSEVLGGNLYDYAHSRARFVDARTAVLRDPRSAHQDIDPHQAKLAARNQYRAHADYERGQRTVARFRAWAASLETLETTGTTSVSVPCPGGLSAQQTVALSLWASAPPGVWKWFDLEPGHIKPYQEEHYGTPDQVPHFYNPHTAVSRPIYYPSSQQLTAAEIGECGTYLWVALGPDGPCLLRNRCKHRQCPACRKYRGYQVACAARTLLEQMTHAKHIVLTRAPRDLSIRDTVQSLLHDFNRLRRTAIWKACLSAGIYTVELKRNPSTHNWHIHLHILVEGKFIPQRALSDAWRRITGDSQVVWVKKAMESTPQYIAKYIAKGSENDLQPFEEWPYWSELAGVRLCGTFGGAPGIESLQPDPQHSVIAPLYTVQQWAMEGNLWAQQLLAQIADRMLTPEPQEASP